MKPITSPLSVGCSSSAPSCDMDDLEQRSLLAKETQADRHSVTVMLARGSANPNVPLSILLKWSRQLLPFAKKRRKPCSLVYVLNTETVPLGIGGEPAAIAGVL
ncbi:hypothetical protein U9M48_011294 [Paspalum notatum var. saurae]|uniref:Uncharacterized protein n=1 Tax=Paspalum notatum var. saurae TaxID=547442 RepID=A0AAQ3SVF5_PASNO